MTDTKRQPHDCEPVTDNPAEQPKPPGDGSSCVDPKPDTPPTLDPPAPCPETDCCCPPGPSTTPNCLQDLIDEQSKSVAAAEKAGKFKEELVKLLDSAKKASADYSRDKYDDLVKKWTEQDLAIATLIQQLICLVRCWRCVVECHVCPPINRVIIAEKWLYGDGTLPTSVGNLYDLQYWHTRNRDAKQRAFDRVDAVMKAWASPGKTIEGALAANLAAINAVKSAMNTEPGKAVYDLFIKLIPLHLAIAPPKNKVATRIDKKYTEFCTCDQPGTPDNCCGPDVGPLTVRKRITGPQPYLIDPNEYFMLICCLVKERYGPAREALTQAEGALASVQNDITRYKAVIDGVKDFEKTVRPTVPSAINCCDYECDDDDGGKTKPRQAY